MASIFQRVKGFFQTYPRSIGFGLEHLGFLTLKHPRIMGVAVLAFTALCLAQVPRASVDGDILRVYQNSGQYYTAYKDLADTFGTFENDIYLLVTSPKTTDPTVLEKMRNLALDLEINDYAVGTMSPFTLRKPGPDNSTVPAVPEGMTSPEQVSAALTDLHNNDPMMRNLILGDLSGVVMIMFPDPAKTAGKGQQAMIQSLRDLVAEYNGPDLHVELTGPPIWTADMLGAAVKDQFTFTVYGFGLGALIALFSLRSFWGAILVSAAPFMAVMWVVGVVMLLFGSFSFLTNIVTILVLVIAFAESMFFCFNWFAYWRDGLDPIKAVDATVKVEAPAFALTGLTTCVSFASLAFTPGQGILEFAIAGTIASALNYVCLVTFMPLLMKTAVRLGFKLPRAPGIALTGPMSLSWMLVRKYARVMAVLAIFVTGLLLVPYFTIQPRFSFQDFVAKDSHALDAAQSIDQGVGGVAPLYVQVPLPQGTPELGDASFETIKKVHDIVEKHLGAGKVISAASFTHYSDAGFTRKQIFDAVGPFLKRRFITDDGKQALVTGFMPTIIESNDLRKLVDDIQADLDTAKIPAEIGGFRLMTTFATTNIVQGLQQDFAASIFVDLALIGIAFRSFRVAVAASIPNLFPVLGTEAYLWLSGSGLQLTTVIALTIAFGIAVDDTTHFLSHYLHERREHGMNHRDAIKHTMDRIGGAIIATTLILCSGTAIVMFSALPQVALFGQLFVITLLLAVLGDVFILPALLYAGGRFFHPLGGVKQHVHH